MLLDLFNVIKYDSDTAGDGWAVDKDSLISVRLVEIRVCITELRSCVFNLLVLVVDVNVYDCFGVIVNVSNLIEDVLVLFVEEGDN